MHNHKPDKNMFCFVIPVYNSDKYIGRCLDSITEQTYTNWRAVVVDDCSTDKTFRIASSSTDTRIQVRQNDTRRRQAYSRYTVYTQAEDNEICVMLDGDDWLYDEHVLTKLNTLYSLNPNLVTTYGGFVWHENNKTQSLVRGQDEFPVHIVEQQDYRNYKWISQHMRTMRAHAIKNIPTCHLKYDGEWLKAVTDRAEMLYALEQSNGHHCNNNFLGYVYNVDSSKSFDTTWVNRSDTWNKYYSNVKQHLRDMK